MVNYLKLGYNSKKEYQEDFENTLLVTNHTYDYFVNWQKVFSKIENYKKEIAILNTLNKSNNIENDFKELLVKYPEIKPLIASLLGIREKNIDIFDTDKLESKKINVSTKNDGVDELVNFSKKTGLLDLFLKIDDVYSYCIGIETGLDSNARKNRSGKIFEDIVGELLSQKIKNHPKYSLSKEDTISFNRTKRWDYVIYKNNQPKFFFECNFYNASGSKPIEVANAYVDLQNQLRGSDLTFIWITDGKGWKKMNKSLNNVSDEIDYILNYKMLSDRIDKILFD